MKFYISTTGIKRLTISSAGAGKGSPSTAATRRISVRTVLPLLLVLALVLPFLFVRIAFIVLESATACSSTLGEADRGRGKLWFQHSRFCSWKLRDEEHAQAALQNLTGRFNAGDRQKSQAAISL
ncbi:hypothetical protein ACFX2C_044365 [Malus domestica]